MPSLYAQHKLNWQDCTKCLLHERRTKVVLARGKIPCEVLFVGEAPGDSEDVIGQPFIGPAGKFLEENIIKPVLTDQWTYAFTNLVACIPLDSDNNKTAEPPHEAIVACRPRLVEIMEICQPRLTVLVGTLAKKHVPLGPDWPSVSILHPAAILRMDISQKGLAVQRTVVDLEMALSSVVPF